MIRIVKEARRDDGLTLIELLVTVMIMGIAFVAILGGLLTAVSSADIHRKQANVQSIVRSLSEKVKSEAYKQCAVVTDYGSTFTPIQSGYSTSVLEVEYWDGDRDPSAPAQFSGAPCVDHGLQRITLQVAEPDARVSEKLVMFKRCEGEVPTTCPAS